MALQIFDTFANLISGLGVIGRDKTMSQRPVFNFITYNPHDLEAMYRSDWVSRP